MGRSREYQTAYDRLKEVLQKEPKARERKNKNRAVAYILRMDLFYQTFEGVDPDKVRAIVKAVGTLDRAWRKVVEENPELRGSDYAKKDKEEQEVQVALGYGDYPPHIKKDMGGIAT